MKGIFTVIIILIIDTALSAQTKKKVEPFIIKGQIANCPGQILQIYFKDADDRRLIDTIHLDKWGNFYLKTFKVQEPQETNIQNKNFQINKILVAPGYELTVTGDGKDHATLFKSKKISGTGAESNQYRILLDSIAFARANTIRWYDLSENDLLSYIKKDQQLNDSVAQAVFGRHSKKDKFLQYFGSMVRLDNQFSRLYMLAAHVNWNSYNYEKAVSFIRSNFDKKLLDNLYKDEYLVSNYYRDWIITGEWLDYLVNLDFKKDSTLKGQKDYKFKKINDTYSGKVKAFALYARMERAIDLCKSVEALNDCVKRYEQFGSTLSNIYYRENLIAKLEEKKMDLLRTEVGKPAPPFALESSQGIRYHLKDFKNKVVYIDLWASWCGPCREETPILKALYKQFKNDDRIAFVSIAVHDEESKWKKAISDDKPDWLQLFDRDGIVARSYFANLIPQFVLIDKQGLIIDFHAPFPSSGKKLEDLLRREIVK